VADDTDPVVSGIGAELLDRPFEGSGRPAHVRGEETVVEGGDVGEAAVPQGTLEHGEDGVVVDDSVHQQDGGGRGIHADVHQAALRGRQSAEAVVPVAGPGGRTRQQADRIPHQVR
jgi:hypothetical protein